MDEYDLQQLQVELRVKQQATSVATWVIGVPLVLAPFVIFAFIPQEIVVEPAGVLVLLIWAAGILLGIAILAGVGIGCAATWIVSNSWISAVTLSFAMGLVVDLVILGWVAVIVQ